MGTQLLTSSLAALAVAVYCGVPLQQAAMQFRDIQPVMGRMCPIALPNGAVVIRDEFNPTMATLDQALETLSQAEAKRRIVITGDVVDTGLTVRPRLREMGRRMAGVADVAVFLGKESFVSARSAVAAGMKPESARGFATVGEAAAFLKTELRAGDLVLLRGWESYHIERAILSQMGTVACHKGRCRKHCSCDVCPELGLVPFEPTPAPPLYHRPE